MSSEKTARVRLVLVTAVFTALGVSAAGVLLREMQTLIAKHSDRTSQSCMTRSAECHEPKALIKPSSTPPSDQASPFAGHIIRVFLEHGLIEQGLAEIKTFRDSASSKDWSPGRICWYTSLYHRLDNNHGAARAWARRAKSHGIPELGNDAQDFWLQFGSWDHPPDVRIIRDRIASASPSPFRVASDQSDPEKNTQGIVGEIRKELEKKEPNILDHIRLATWKLLLGEYTQAHHERLHLPTTSINSLLEGRKHLKEIEARIEASPELEDEISTDTQLAIRLDTARVRMTSLKQSQELSRENERRRLNQLRDIATTYKTLNRELIKWQTYHALGDQEKTGEAAKDALAQLQAIFKEVNKHTDYHLFKDEPKVEGEPGDDFKVLKTQPRAFADNSISMLKSLQGLAYYNRVRDQPNPDPEMLKNAERWANLSLSDENKKQSEVPPGADPNNLIAHMLLGLIADSQGERLAFSQKEEQRKDAKKSFTEAKTRLQNFLKQIRAQKIEPGDDGIFTDQTKRLVEMAKQTLSHLDSVGKLTEDARAKADTNQPEAARRSLEIATKRHRKPATALEAIEIGLRAGMPLEELEDEWKKYGELTIVDPDTPEAQLTLAQIRNLRAGQALGRPGKEVKTKSAAELFESREKLDQWAEDLKLPDSLRMAVKANLALAFAYGWALGDPNGDGTKVNQSDIEATHRHAQDAIAVLTKALEGKDPAHDTVEQLRMREAMIAARIAAGHLYYMHLAEHRDESKLEFHAAADEAARLNNAPPVLPLIGSPLLRQVFEQSEGGESKLANQERQRRKMMTLWLEAMYADEFGASSAAATQMQEAEKLAFGGDGNANDKLQRIDASELAAAADGFDAKVALPDTCRAFTILTLVNAQQYDKALTKAVVLASKQSQNPESASDITQELLSSSIASINSPLVAFTCAKAIEEFAASLPVGESLDRREMLVAESMKTYRKGIELLNSERLAVRFPHMLALINNAVELLSSPDKVYAQTIEANKEQRYFEAIEYALFGLSRHPKNQLLWRAYFTAKTELIKSGRSATAEEMESLLTELSSVNANGLLSDFETTYLTATILEALGRYVEAQTQYLDAVGLAGNNTRNKIQAQANAARLRAANATAHKKPL